MAETSATGAHRVKVYVLNDSDKWDDRGIGQVRCERDHRTGLHFLKVLAEDSGFVAMCSQVRSLREAYYQMQEDTIISWQEDPLPNSNESPTEIALSFAEANGCREIWEKIRQIDSILSQTQSDGNNNAQEHHSPQTHDLSSNHGLPSATLPLPMSITPHHDAGPDPLVASDPGLSGASRNPHNSLVDASTDITHSTRFFDEHLDIPSPWASDPIDDVIFRDNTSVLFLGSPGALVPTTAAAAGFVMPEPDRSGVEDLYRIMSEQGAIHVPAARERIISGVLSGNYVSKLCEVFRECERSTDIEGLAMLYHVIRCFFLVGTAGVLEVLVNEKNLMDIVGCLEYDQDHIAELERAHTEAKRSEAGRCSKSAGNLPNESTASSEKCCGADQTSAKTAKDRVESSAQSSVVEQSQKAPTNKGTATDSRNGHREESASQGAGSSPVVTNADKGQAADFGGADMNADGHVTNVPPSKAVEATHSSAADNEGTSQKTQKNLSEETTSSGNIVTGDGERRLVVRIHRDFLERKITYKSVVPITDENVVAKIHQNYRVGYIRDVILSRAFDENANGALSGVILFNNVDIMMYFISGSSALQELFDRLKSAVEQRRKERSALPIRESALPVDAESPRKTCVPTKKRCSLSAEISGPNPRKSESPTQEPWKVAASDSSSLSPLKGNSKYSCRSGVTATTGESNVTVGDPSTSKEASSRAVKSEGRVPFDSTADDPISSQSEDDIQSGLCSLLGLLKELCIVAKGQQPPLKNRFHTLLTELGVLEVTVSLLLDDDVVIRSLCCDILTAAIIHDQTEVRSRILRNVPPPKKNEVKRIGVPLRSAPVRLQSEVDSNRVLQKQNEIDMQVNVPCLKEYEPKSPSPKGISSVEKIPTAAAGTADSPRVKGQGSTNVERGAPKEIPSKSKCPEAGDLVPAAAEVKSSAADIGTSAGTAIVPAENGKKGTRMNKPDPENTPVLPGSLGQASGGPVPSEGEHRKGAGKNEGLSTSVAHPKQVCGKSLDSRVADEQFPILAAMVGVVCEDREGELALSVLELLRLLLDPSNMRTQSDKETFLNVFYENFISRLLSPILKCVQDERDRAGRSAPCGRDGNIGHISDLLSFCVVNHAYRGRYFVLGWDVGGRIAKLVDHRRAHIRLSALRFVRACVGMSEDMLDRYIIGENLFDPIMAMLGRNGNRDNLTSSAVLDVVVFISMNCRFELLKHILEKYGDVLEPTSRYCSVLEDARRRFESLVHDVKGPRNAEGSESAKVTGGCAGLAAKATMNVDLKSLEEGPGTACSGNPKLRSVCEPDGSNRRLVSGRMEQEIRIPNDQDSPEKLFTPCGPDGNRTGDLNSLVIKSASGEKAVRGEIEVRDNCKCSGKDDDVDSNRAIVEDKAFDRLKSRELIVNGEVRKRETARDSSSDKRRKPSLVSYGAGDSDEEGEEIGNMRGVGCMSGGSGGSSVMRMSLSKSGVKSGELQLEDDTGVGISDTSEDSGSPRKRERSGKVVGGVSGRGWMGDGGIETCTRAVMERHQNEVDDGREVKKSREWEEREGSPPKRQRIVEGGRDTKEATEVVCGGKRKRSEEGRP